LSDRHDHDPLSYKVRWDGGPFNPCFRPDKLPAIELRRVAADTRGGLREKSREFYNYLKLSGKRNVCSIHEKVFVSFL
jgi:hypothetical protein